MNYERAIKLRKVISDAMQSIDDETAVDFPLLYPEWDVGKQYEVGIKLLYNNELYKVLQAHTSQADWTPDIAVSLFAKVLAGQDGTDIGVWVQPDSTNPYMIGDRVHYPTMDDPIYESTIDNNVWSPSAYPAGWRVVE